MAIKNTWLRVTLRPNANTGLAAADVSYWGNLVGESGDSTSPLRITAMDTAAVRRAFTRPGVTVGVSSACDFNRDGRVDAADLALVRNNVFHTLTRSPRRPPRPPRLHFHRRGSTTGRLASPKRSDILFGNPARWCKTSGRRWMAHAPPEVPLVHENVPAGASPTNPHPQPVVKEFDVADLYRGPVAAATRGRRPDRAARREAAPGVLLDRQPRRSSARTTTSSTTTGRRRPSRSATRRAASTLPSGQSYSQLRPAAAADLRRARASACSSAGRAAARRPAPS